MTTTAQATIAPSGLTTRTAPAEVGERAREVLAGAYARAHLGVASCWLFGTPAAGVACWSLAPEALPAVSVVSVGSGLIAHLALLPGTWRYAGALRGARSAGPVMSLPAAEPNRSPAEDALPLMLTATAIRLAGTVALFSWCRYQMAGPLGVIVAAALCWYVVLTSLEIGVLSRALPQLDRLGCDRLGSFGPAPGGGRQPLRPPFPAEREPADSK